VDDAYYSPMTNQQQWFYIDNKGQQVGPVETTELISLISRGALNESSMAWTEGMHDWQLISQIETLEQPVAQSKIAATGLPQPSATISNTSNSAAPASMNPYEPPRAAVPTHSEFRDAGALTTEYSGIKRLNYFVRNVILLVLLFVFIGLAITTYPDDNAYSIILALVGLLIFLVFYIRFALLRIRNMGASGWWLLLMLVPLASNVLAIALLSCPEGFAHHKKMDTTGIIVAVILGGLTLLSFIANIASALLI